MKEKLKKTPVAIIFVMAASLLLAVLCIAYSVYYQYSVKLTEKYGNEKELAVSAIRSALRDMSKESGEENGRFLLASYDTDKENQ